MKQPSNLADKQFYWKYWFWFIWPLCIALWAISILLLDHVFFLAHYLLWAVVILSIGGSVMYPIHYPGLMRQGGRKLRVTGNKLTGQTAVGNGSIRQKGVVSLDSLVACKYLPPYNTFALYVPARLMLQDANGSITFYARGWLRQQKLLQLLQDALVKSQATVDEPSKALFKQYLGDTNIQNAPLTGDSLKRTQ